MTSFSVGVRFEAVDDILGDPNECVLPLLLDTSNENDNAASASNAPAEKANVAATNDLVAGDVAPQSFAAPKVSKGDEKDAQLKIRAADCLSCKGCVTTEALNLLEKHSWEELVTKMQDDTVPLVVLSVSPQSLVRLCQAFDFSGDAETFLAMFRAVLTKRFGGKVLVVGTATADAIAVLESEIALQSDISEGDSSGSNKKPIVSSQCPGWTIYAQRTTKPWVVEHLFPRRSAQQIQGNILKTKFLEWYRHNRFRRNYALHGGCGFDRYVVDKNDGKGRNFERVTDIFHAYVAPCHDKKVEASLPEFALKDGRKEVDLVVATAEIILWVNETVPDWAKSLNSKTLLTRKSKTSLQQQPYMTFDCSSNVPAENSDSGGYWSHLLRDESKNPSSSTKQANQQTNHKRAQHKNVDGKSTASSTPSNRDEQLFDSRMKLVPGKDGLYRSVGGQPYFYLAYGIMNAHNVLRQLENMKNRGGHAQFVDILACPGGCLNGGGQVLPDEAETLTKQQRKDRLADLQKRFNTSLKVVPADQNTFAVDVARERMAQEQKNATYKSFKMEKTSSSLQW